MRKKLTSLMLVLAFVITSILGVMGGTTEVQAEDCIPFKSAHSIKVDGVIYRTAPLPDGDAESVDSDKVYGVTAIGWMPYSCVDQNGLLKCKFYIGKGKQRTGYVPVSDVVTDSPKRWAFKRKISGTTNVAAQTYKTDYSAYRKLKADKVISTAGFAMYNSKAYVVFKVKRIGNLLINVNDISITG